MKTIPPVCAACKRGDYAKCTHPFPKCGHPDNLEADFEVKEKIDDARVKKGKKSLLAPKSGRISRRRR